MPGSALTQLDRYGAATNQASFGALQVWVDQDLCTGDGICVDYCPEVFVLLEDGIAYVREAGTVMNDPGCAESPARVQLVHEAAVMSAALDCPGECIFIETVAGRPRGDADDQYYVAGGVTDTSLTDPMARRPHPWNREFTWEDHRGPFTTVTEEQATAFDRDGFFVLDQVFSPTELGDMRAAVEPGCPDRARVARALPRWSVLGCRPRHPDRGAASGVS